MKRCNAEQITVLSALISAQMARGLTADEVELLAALLDAVANNLALIAAIESGSCAENGTPQAPESPAPTVK